MIVTAFRSPLVKAGDDIRQILIATLPQKLPEESFVVVTSKIVSFCENRLIPKNTGDRNEKHELVKKEAEYYIDPHSSKYDLMLTIKRNWIFVNAGMDESNAEGQYILWPADLQKSADEIWKFVREQYGVKKIGVTISDSASKPMSWGVTGHAIAHSGFNPLKSYIGKPDLFGRLMKMEQVNIAQSITAAAVLEMGEGAEQTPIALVENVKNVEFMDRVPTKEELAALHIEMEDDAYAPILQSAPWKKGDAGVDL